MGRYLICFASLLCGTCSQIEPAPAAKSASPSIYSKPVQHLEISEHELRDKIEGAWLGQMIGVTWGFPTEFYARFIWKQFPDLHQVDGQPQNIYTAYEGGPIPLAKLPTWKPELINGGYTQDDLYVEVPFMEALRTNGVNAGWNQLGAAFAQSEFPLWHANAMARKNLRHGIAAPLSGHYANNPECDDIDWQIEADFVGLCNPGQRHSAAEMAFRIGHVMNYGDGVYGGVFVATMIAQAFTANSIQEIVHSGCEAVPPDTLYRTMLDEVMAAYERGDRFEDNLAALNAKWGIKDRCVEWGGDRDPLNIDAKMNGCYILLGLLYGRGDLADSMRYAMTCGQDSDCNPSNVGSVLGAYYGRKAIAQQNPEWLSALDTTRVFQTTNYRLDQLVELNLQLARDVVLFKGGSAPAGGTWRIPVLKQQVPLIREQWPLIPNTAPALDTTVIPSGLSVTVKAEASDDDGIASVQWFFGDLSFATGPHQQHTYRQPGQYDIVAYVTDAIGNTSVKLTQVTVP